MGYIDDGLVSIVMPTTGRTDSALEAVKCVVDTVKNQKIEFVCVVDVDTGTPEALVETLTKYQVPFKLVWDTNYHGHSRSWNRGLRCADGGVIVFFSDDLRAKEGWLDEALRVLKKRLDGYGVVGFDGCDGSVATGQATHFLVSRKFIVEQLNGCIAFEHYEIGLNDIVVHHRAKAVGHYAIAEDAVVERLFIEDATKARNKGDKGQERNDNISKTREQINERQTRDFPNDFEPAIIR